MRLDHDEVRALLLAIEASDDIHGLGEPEAKKFADSRNLTRDQLAYIVKTLNDGDIITGKVTWGGNQPMWITPGNLTYLGHEYLDNIRSPKVWNETKSIASKVGSVSLDIMATIASNVIAKSLGL